MSLEMTHAELEKIHSEIAKLMAETSKLNAETSKLRADTFWYPHRSCYWPGERRSRRDGDSHQALHVNTQAPRKRGLSLGSIMQRIKHYQPPTTEDLTQLKAQLKASGMKATGQELADLAGLSDDRQWRKYTGGAQPRELSAQMLFFIAARLTLPEEQLASVYAKMREIGATLEFEG